VPACRSAPPSGTVNAESALRVAVAPAELINESSQFFPVIF